MARQVYCLAIAASIILLLNIGPFFHAPLPSTPSLRSRFPHRAKTEKQKVASVVSYQDNEAVTRHQLKPWPHLQSLLPWLPAPSKYIPHSCEGYFGNGFTERISIFSTSSDREEEGPLQCLYSKTLHTSICESRSMVMHPDRISMSSGGEPLHSVVGRTDAEELPSFSPRAFEIILPPTRWHQEFVDWAVPMQKLNGILPQGHIQDHKLQSLFKSIRTTSSDRITCSEVQREPTLVVIRFEYANLFHTATDWYSAYVTSRVLGLKKRPHVIFMDGHCQSPMDDGWKALFSSIRFAKNFTASACFDHLLFVPLGYETAMFKGLNSGIRCRGCKSSELSLKEDEGKTARLREFGEMFKAALNVVDRNSYGQKKILLVRREDYLAHPRHVGRPEVRLQNEQELFEAMEAWAQRLSHGGVLSVSIINGTLAHLKMKEQVQAVHDASVIVGVHGAGLTHILFARPGTVVLELTSPSFPRPHYSHISQWMGLEYHSVTMPGTWVDCTQVLQQLSKILNSSLL